MKVTEKGQVTIPPELRKRHGLLPHREVEFVDQPDGVLVVKAAKLTRGKRTLAVLLRGGKIKGRTDDWLRLTRGKHDSGGHQRHCGHFYQRPGVVRVVEQTH